MRDSSPRADLKITLFGLAYRGAAAMGVALGVAMHNLALGLALGVAIGVVMGRRNDRA